MEEESMQINVLTTEFSFKTQMFTVCVLYCLFITVILYCQLLAGTWHRFGTREGQHLHLFISIGNKEAVI